MKKTFSPVTLIAGLAMLSAPIPGFTQGVDDVVRAFEKNGEYVKPISTLFGSILNSGWYQSAAVRKGFGFYLGLPLSITHIADGDRSYDTVFTDDGCIQAHGIPGNTANCRERITYTTPTIFGRDSSPTMYMHNPDITGDINANPTTRFDLNDGMEVMAQMNWLPFGIPLASMSYYHTELKLRWLGLPEIKGASFGIFGVGLQHDFASFLPRFVPNMPVNVSLAGNMSWLSVSWAPGDSIDGAVELNGFSHFLGLLVGYTYKGWAEAFLEAGWEGSSVETGGTLTINDAPNADEIIRPRLKLEGRNAFRASINLAIHFGYNAVLSQSVGANMGQSVDIMSYRYK